MLHVIMGIILAITSTLLVIGAILTSPKLERMGVRHSARYSFATVAVLVGLYLGWVANLFFRNELGPENYVLELWAIRIGLMVASAHFVWAIWRCDK
jgi:hypothetical protein